MARKPSKTMNPATRMLLPDETYPCHQASENQAAAGSEEAASKSDQGIRAVAA